MVIPGVPAAPEASSVRICMARLRSQAASPAQLIEGCRSACLARFGFRSLSQSSDSTPNVGHSVQSSGGCHRWVLQLCDPMPSTPNVSKSAGRGAVFARLQIQKSLTIGWSRIILRLEFASSMRDRTRFQSSSSAPATPATFARSQARVFLASMPDVNSGNFCESTTWMWLFLSKASPRERLNGPEPFEVLHQLEVRHYHLP